MPGAIYIDATTRERIADNVWDEYLLAIPRYRSFVGTPIETDIRERTRMMIDSFIDLADGDSQPDVADRLNFGAIAVSRLRQGFTLEDILRATRLEGRVLWTHISRSVPESRLAEMGLAMLQLLEVTSAELETIYATEMNAMRASRDEATHLFLQRFMSEEALPETIDGEAALIDYPATGMHTAIIITPTALAPEAAVPRALAKDLARRMRQLVPAAISATVDARMFVAAPLAFPDNLLGAVTSVAEEIANLSDGHVRAGIGSAYPGLAGLRRSTREAVRAAMIASIIDSGRLVAVHADLRVFDIFREGAPIQSFVREVLGALIDHDEQRGTGLVATLRSYYDTGFNRKLTASRLMIHVNTLDYRLQQISRIIESPGVTGFSDFRVPLALKLSEQIPASGNRDETRA